MDHVIYRLMFIILIYNAEVNTLVEESPELKPPEFTARNEILRSKDIHILGIFNTFSEQFKQFKLLPTRTRVNLI